MSNAVIDDFTAPLGGTAYQFHFGLREVIALQEHLPKVPDLRVPGGWRTPTVDEINAHVKAGRLLYFRALIWVGLRKFQPAISEDATTDLIAAASDAELTAVLEGFGYSVTPDPADLEVLGPPPRPDPPTAQPATSGETSTPSPVEVA